MTRILLVNQRKMYIPTTRKYQAALPALPRCLPRAWVHAEVDSAVPEKEICRGSPELGQGHGKQGGQEGRVARRLQVTWLSGPLQLLFLLCKQFCIQLLASTSSSHSMQKYILFFFSPKENRGTNLPSSLCSPHIGTRYILAAPVRGSQASCNRCSPHQWWQTPSRCQHIIKVWGKPIPAYARAAEAASEWIQSRWSTGVQWSFCQISQNMWYGVWVGIWYLTKLKWDRQTMPA